MLLGAAPAASARHQGAHLAARMTRVLAARVDAPAGSSGSGGETPGGGSGSGGAASVAPAGGSGAGGGASGGGSGAGAQAPRRRSSASVQAAGSVLTWMCALLVL